ncbi:Biogenesis of lysosome-related organelles complex 1 subunit 5 [Frankliniella fusca]|uniref:Biogenesis of lysosome-related organelles complex 1 subunit 5 n=1 Tax=Frankliniella fusca TaxID=407009 RepID=A0AAE1HR01_9NEOP|nr:Biogenesis of lysosome-related organelles complex 1 subunit 5 [Frankliniella fusca]
MAAIVKDAGEIWTRLFDHRPYLSGEIKFFLREFEEKRQDREVERLFVVLERVTEIRDTQLDRLKHTGETYLPTLITNLDAALNMCNRMIKSEEEHLADNSLEAKRALRKADWQNFISDMAGRCSKVDSTFQEKEGELREFYEDLEAKLHIVK